MVKISIIASDLSSSGAGRWGGGVRPFLLSQALKKIGCDVEILGFVDANSPINISHPEIFLSLIHI